MPPPDPGTALILFVVGGIATVVTFTAYRFATSEGPDLSTRLPSFLPKLPPLPDIRPRGA